jgi:TusA-related sulfurtransferase
MAYKVLKNANCLPPEIELRKEIRQMEDLLEAIPDEKEKYRQIKRINRNILFYPALNRSVRQIFFRG